MNERVFVPLMLTAIVLCTPTPSMAQSTRQYKRVHQQALKLIVDHRAPEAIDRLEAFIDQSPDDAESHYMLTVAFAAVGDRSRAVQSMQRALELGLPADRFVAGTLTGLEPLRDEPLFRRLRNEYAHRPVHGPLLGNVSGSGISVWVRTAGESTVQVSAVSGTSDPIWSRPIRATRASDFTAVVRLDGLAPKTAYEYTVHLDGKPFRQANYRFKTMPPRGQPVRLRVAFGGGAGFVPENERAWTTIAKTNPDILLLLGDNVYIDDPTTPQMQHYCYYRRQSRPEFRALVACTPVFSIWDDHDFATNDSSGGPLIDQPAWKQPVYQVFRNNWANPYYGGGDAQPGCYYDFYVGDLHFVMLDGRYYRDLNPKDQGAPTMLGPAQRAWLLQTLANSQANLLALCSPVPWVFEAKGDSRDTWNGFRQERRQIFDVLAQRKTEGVLLISADRHRSDLWRIDRPQAYSLYEFNSSRLTNQHVHPEMEAAMFSYNKKQSFGLVDIDTTGEDSTITYRVMTIDGEEVHSFTLKRSALR